MTSQNRILIVDDEDPLRLSLSLILQKENYHVDTAANAEEALECLKSHEYDLMFLDLNMPGMSGIELLFEVHRRYPNLAVLILTAHAALESAIQALRLEARDYLIKPVDPPDLLTRVAEILAEGEQPARKREIMSQLQSLVTELKKIEGEDITPASAPFALSPAGPARFLKKGNFELDLHERDVTLNGKYIPVTGFYFDYLCTLLRHAPKAVAYKTLVKESQGFDVTVPEAKDLTRWRIHELRQMIESDPQHPQYILTVRGIGYRLAI
ncbi:MAG TPA: response regulator transcription factor [Anaerolineales bacterium]|nr:response regulator transcription factor [Anaerolineales bacterium]